MSKTSPQWDEFKRVRSTTSTQRRIDNLRKLVAELSARDMLADEVASLLKFSPSGARKYIHDLREAGVIDLARYIDATATYPGRPVFQISPDSERVAQFLASLDQPSKRMPAKDASRSKLDIASRSADRHFHIMRDDAHYPVRVSRAAVAPDPYSLPREFFASVGAS